MSRKCSVVKGDMPPMTSQKRKIVRNLERGERQRGVMASYNMGSSGICETEAPLTIISCIK